jgi:hypothetical protein
MIALGLLFLRLPCDRFKPRQQLEAEILVLRHQLNILHRARGRPHLRWVDRALFIWLSFGQKIEAVEAIVPGVASSGAVPQSMPMHRGQLHLQKQA